MAPWGATDNLYEGRLTQGTGYGESKVEGLSRDSGSAWSADSADGLKKKNASELLTVKTDWNGGLKENLYPLTAVSDNLSV